MPITNNPIQQIQLIFPNSFEIGNVNVPYTYNVNPIPGGLYAGITYSNTDLLGTFITVPTATSTIVITLLYRSCDVHPTINTTPLNINHLFFDCKGFSGGPNIITYNATLVQANPGLQVIGGAAIANYGLTNAPNAIEVVGTPTIFLGSSNNNTYQAVNQEIFLRYFDVTVNPTSLQEFNVHITDEIDVEELELFYVSNSGPVLIQPALLDNTGNAVGFGNYSFSFGNIPMIGFNLIPVGAIYTNPDGSRKITFAQRVQKVCIDDDEAMVTASFDCGLLCSDQIVPPPPQELILDVDPELNVTGINPPNITLTSQPSSGNSICGSNFAYIFDFSYNNDVISILNNFVLPINTETFEVQSVEIGDGTNFTSFSIGTTGITIMQPSATSTLNVDVNSLFGTSTSTINPCFTNVLPNSNPAIYGAWINTNLSITHLVIRINLQLISLTSANCPDIPLNLSRPFPNNNCTLVLSRACGGNISRVFNIDVTSPPVTGAQITANFPQNIDLGVSPALPVSYMIQIPEQSPFEIMSDNVSQISCVTTVYQAVLSMGNGELFGINAIPTATIIANGITTTIAPTLNVAGAYVFDLPLIPASQGFYTYSLSFQLDSIACPPCTTCTTAATYGAYVYNLQVAAICQDCNPEIRRNIICAQNPLEVHCIGTCDSPVGFNHTGNFPDIERITLGWIDENDFKNNPNTPLTAIGFNNLATGAGLNQSQIEEQLNSVYPFDLFTYKAKGSAKPELGFTITSAGLQLRYPQTTLGGNFLQLINYEAVFTETNNSSSSFVVNNNNYPLQLTPSIQVPAQTTQPISVAVPSFTQEMQWEVGSTANPLVGLFPLGIDINNTSYEITVTATFRMIATTPAGSFGLSINGQFVGLSNDGAGTIHNLTSCDPWHTDLKVIIPNVQVFQNSAFTGNINLPNTGSIVGQVNTPNTTACKFGHAIGIRHSGGNGALPDFFPEYRPLTSWPQQINAADIESGTGFFPGSYTYTVAGGNLINGTDPLLPPLTRQLPQNNLQGLVLTLTEDCPNSGNLTLPSDLVINRYAYINNQHLINTPPPPSPPTNPTIAAATNPPAGNTNCSFLTLPSGPGIINLSNATPSHIYDFNLQIPASALNLPFAIRITPPLNPNVSIPINSSNIIIPGSTQINNTNWFVFNAGLPNTNALQCSMGIQIVGNNGCYDLPFDVEFEVQVYCNAADLPSSTNQNPIPCLTCSTTQAFQRGVMDLNNADITTNFSISPSGCDLVFELNLTNPDDQPTIHAAGLILQFSTGMILQQPVGINFSGSGVVNSSFNSPYYLNQNLNGLATGGIYQLTANGVTLFPGETLTYTLTFQLGESWCDGLYDASTALFGVSLLALNGCEPYVNIPVTINQTSLSNFISLISQNVNCCVPNPEVTVTHVCDQNATDGVIEVNYPNFGPGVSVTIFRPVLCTQLPCSWTTTFSTNPLIISAANAPFGFGIGTYRLVVWDANTGAYFEQFVEIEDYSFLYVNLMLSQTEVCSGATIDFHTNFSTLSVNAGSLIDYQINMNGSPIPGASGQIVNGTPPISNIYQTTVTATSTFSIILTNGSCSITSNDITVAVNPNPVIANDVLSICTGSSFNYDPIGNTSNIIPAGTGYSWSAPTVTGGITGGTAGNGTTINQTNLINPTNNDQTATYTVTATYQVPGSTTLFCDAVFDLVVTVNPTPVISTQTIDVCSGSTFNIAPVNGGGNIVPLNTLYSWALPTLTGNLTGASAQNNQTSVSETLINNTNATQTATYLVTASNGICSSTFNAVVNVLVLPSASVSPLGTINLCQNSSVQLTATGGTNYSWSPSIGLNNPLISDPIANPLVSTTYIVTVTGSNLCTSTASTQVNVIPLPTTPTLTAGGPTTFCAGSAVTLSTPFVAGCTYWWMNGSTTINGATSNTYSATSSGSYTVAILNSNNCISTSNAVLVTVYPLPTVTITANPGTTVILPTSVTLTAQITAGATVVDWFDPTNTSLGSTATSISINPATTGIYTYTVVVSSNGCTASTTIDIEVVQVPLVCIPNSNTQPIGTGTQYASNLVNIWSGLYPGNVTLGSATTPTIIQGINFAVLGEFVVDWPLIFIDVNFYCYDNTRITNISQNSLHFAICTFSACNNLWRGIENNGDLVIRNCTIEDAFYGVKMNWESINDIHHNTFRNNLYGIYSSIGIGSTNNIQFLNYGNTFTNPNNLKPWHNGNILLNLQRSLAGIYLNNFGDAEIDFPISGAPTLSTIFDNISCGIYTSNTSLIVNNAYFNNITPFSYQVFNNLTPVYSGTGIYHRSGSTPFDLGVSPYQGAFQGITFKNCTTGINLRRSNAKIYDIGFQGVRSGILGSNLALCEVYIGSNLINASVNGISLNTVDDNDYITISDNRINVFSFDNLSTGIYIGAASNTSTANSPIFVDLNRIQVFNGRAGILTQNIENPTIKENRVTRNIFGINLNLPPWLNIQLNPNPDWAGINSQNNKGAKITCNEIFLGWIAGNPVNTGSDIRINDSEKTELISNKVEGKAFRGIDIWGTCTDSKIETNEIGPHTEGLHLSNTANIGTQPNWDPLSGLPPPTEFNANIWSNEYITNPTSFLGGNNQNYLDGFGIPDQQVAALNRFYVNPTLNPPGLTYHPQNFPDNLPGFSWFDPKPWFEKVNPACGVIPPIIAPISSTISLNEAIALGLVTASEYRDQTKWVLNKNLLALLKSADTLLFINDTLLQFYTDPAKNNLKKLNAIEDTIKHVKSIKDQYASQIAQYQNQMDVLRQNMSQQCLLMLDSLQHDSASFQYQLLKQDYMLLSNQKQDLVGEIIDERNDLADAGLLANNSFVPENFNEALSKTVNDIYYRTYGRGIDTLSAQDIALLQSIIHICPQAGGPAVYRARALYITVNDTIEYHDSLVCMQANFFREAQQQWEQKVTLKVSNEKISLQVFPNPFTGILHWRIIGEHTDGVITIKDMMGKNIINESVATSKKEGSINLSDLTQGVYILQYTDKELITTKKIVKQ